MGFRFLGVASLKYMCHDVQWGVCVAASDEGVLRRVEEFMFMQYIKESVGNAGHCCFP